MNPRIRRGRVGSSRLELPWEWKQALLLPIFMVFSMENTPTSHWAESERPTGAVRREQHCDTPGLLCRRGPPFWSAWAGVVSCWSKSPPSSALAASEARRELAARKARPVHPELWAALAPPAFGRPVASPASQASPGLLAFPGICGAFGIPGICGAFGMPGICGAFGIARACGRGGCGIT